MTNTHLIIMGSSRSDGETAQSVAQLNKDNKAEIIDLLKFDIGFYDYDYKNQNDDFMSVSQKMIAAQTIIFATPIYWYAMSGPLKVFFDRFSDLVRIRKPEGRQMAGKKVWLLANGTDTELPEGFEVPFQSTCRYLDMEYKGACYLYAGKDEALRGKSWAGIDGFRRRVFA
jgi:multimeric flavodoxin WrbA